MAYSRRDFQKMAKLIKEKEAIDGGGYRPHYLTRSDRSLLAMFMADYFHASDPLFDRLAFYTACGF